MKKGHEKRIGTAGSLSRAQSKTLSHNLPAEGRGSTRQIRCVGPPGLVKAGSSANAHQDASRGSLSDLVCVPLELVSM